MSFVTVLKIAIYSLIVILTACSSKNEKALKQLARQVEHNREDSTLLTREDSILASLTVNIWDEKDTVFKGDRNFGRQVLLVKSQDKFYSVVNNGHNTSSFNAILLKGVPSPNSDDRLNRAIIVFLPDSLKLKPPMYIKALGEIRLYFYESKLTEIENYISENAICCICELPDGKIYGDIHKY